MGEVKKFPVLGRKSRRRGKGAEPPDDQRQMAEELLAIANRLEQIAAQSDWPKWIGMLALELRRAAMACMED